MFDIYAKGHKSVVGADTAKAIMLDSATAIFCIFAYWDLRRVGVSKANFWLYFFGGIFLGTAFSPALTLALLWGHREVQWSEARQEDTDNDVELDSPRSSITERRTLPLFAQSRPPFNGQVYRDVAETTWLQSFRTTPLCGRYV